MFMLLQRSGTSQQLALAQSFYLFTTSLLLFMPVTLLNYLFHKAVSAEQ